MRNGLRFPIVFPDYLVTGFPEVLGYIVSAAIGAAVLVIAFKLVGALRRGRRLDERP
jgi:cobalt/nickel transport system permease protein